MKIRNADRLSFVAARAAYYAFRATVPGSTAEEEAYLDWIDLGGKLTLFDR
jgi:hypothetical protein